MNDKDERLAQIRARIDEIDVGIQGLITERVAQARQLAGLKREQGGGQGVYRPEREAQVIRKVLERNRESAAAAAAASTGADAAIAGVGAVPDDDDIAHIFREIMSVSLAAQKPLSVATLGPEGTYAHHAAVKHFGGSAAVVLVPSIREIFREVEAGNADFGMAPVENSSEGSVADTLDVLIETPLNIIGELHLRIHHCLLGRELSEVREVLAHGQSLGQCRNWLGRNLPGVTVRAVGSNAEAARLAAATKTTAAIADARNAGLYGLEVLAHGIEDSPHNTTRFVAIGNIATAPSGDDKTSVLMAGRNKPGALYSLLQPISEAGLDMSWLESRATRIGLWEYVFFLDFSGHRLDPQVVPVLAELERQSSLCKVLGSYPRYVA